MGILIKALSYLRHLVRLASERAPVLGSGAVLTAAVLTTTLPMASPGATMPNATTFAGTPAVGALFNYGPKGIGGHFCTGSVVNALRANLVITAAHCVSGHLGPMVFIPGYRDGYTPHGVWLVARVLVDKSWQSSESQNDDFAFLVVKRIGNGDDALARLTGGEEIGVNQPDPRLVRAVGYPDGEQAPIHCENRVFDFTPNQLEFDCGGYVGGTSGGPFITGVNPRTGTGTVVGVIGGYQYGGDTPQISYAAKFSRNLASLYALALETAPPPTG
jgi:V8-like Glu-specific endopeptidase